MEIKFQTIKESKKLQLKEFLKLSGPGRVWCFFMLSSQINRLQLKFKVEKTANFLIHIDIKKITTPTINYKL